MGRSRYEEGVEVSYNPRSYSEGEEDEEEEGMEKLVAPADFDGPTSDRHCTDCFCTLLIIISWIAMTVLGIYSITNGDIRVLVYPLDYDGNICGTDYGNVDMTDYPYLYYLNSYAGGVCVEQCPNLTNVTSDGLTDVFTLLTYGGIYQTNNSEVNVSFVGMASYTNSSGIEEICTPESCYPPSAAYPTGDPVLSWSSEGVNKGWGYAYYLYGTYDTLWRCYALDEASERLKVLTGRDGEDDDSYLAVPDAGADFWNDLYADLWTAKEYILGFGFCVALIVGFVYTLFLRIPCVLSIMVWGSIFLTIGMIGGLGYYAYYLANKWEDEDPQITSDTSINAARISAIVLWALTACLILLMFCLRKQIQLALGCVKEASRSIVTMTGIVLWPVLQAAGFIAFMVVWTIYAAHLASIGELSTTQYEFDGTKVSVRSFVYDDFVKNSAWYLLFCFFWSSQFILAVGEIVVAMCIAKWYFTREKRHVNSCWVVGSIKDTIWYHAGTAAYGSLILAIIKLIRVVMARIQSQVKKANNKCADCLLCCCQCCLWCFEKCIRFLNKNAYVQTAIFGTSFCTSAREAFFLILRNAGRIGAITYVSKAVVIVGKLFICTITTGAAYIYMEEAIGDELYSSAGPAIFIFFISYFVGAMFMNVFDMAIGTILQCFIADEEMFTGDECYAEGKLRKYIDKYGDAW